MDDLARLREEYQERERRLAGSDVYSCFNEASLFTLQQRQRVLLKALKRNGLTYLSRLRLLEMGCGTGGVLKELLALGASPCNMFGVELLGDRLVLARDALPVSGLTNADGQSLPFPNQSVDVVMQFTAISSILDAGIRSNICREMLRVVKKDGLLISYDFWLNPTNPQTRGLRPEEIRGLFPGCRFEFQRITLAPPIARLLVPVSWQLCALLEKLIVFNSHYLSIIHPT